MHKKIKVYPMKSLQFNRAFTLIELLVVIAIVGVLTGFIFVSMNGAVNSAKDAKRKADLSTISRAILEYMAQNNNAYPYTATTTACNLCNNDSCSSPCTGFYANIQPYLANIPIDPNGSTYYTYTYSATPKFVLQSTLSNTYTYKYDSTSGFSTFFNFVSTCTAATNAQVSCTAITISSTEEACKCTYLSGAGTTSWTVPNGVTSVQYLVVGGGGAGSTSQDGPGGGGGGAGGLLTGTESVTTGPYTIKVGNGGTSRNNNAGTSTFNDITANGGGVGGAGGYSCNGGNGGSGAGSAGANCGAGSGTAGQGYAGGIGNGTYGATNTAGGGGGGAGGAGANATSYTAYGAGGVGVVSTITGTSVTYATGGNGNAYNGGAGAAGAANTGNGGQGGACQLVAGGSGGSGIVVLRYTHP